MSIHAAVCRFIMLAIVALAAMGLPASAQSVRPPDNAVKNATPAPGGATAEPRSPALDPFWGEVRRGVQGQVSIPDKQAGVLVQSGGESWRNFRNGPLSVYGAYALGFTVALLTLFYLIRGRIRIEHGFAGRTIERFTDLERMSHWLMAISFIVLGITGLNVLYGRYVLLPMIGKDAFAGVSLFGKWLHNYVAFAFMVGLLLSFVLWVRHNFPSRHDVTWVLQGGGIIGSGHPPAKKFNFGQKVLFWLVMLGGVSISLSGLALMFPFQTAMFAKTFAFLNIFGLGLPATATPMQEMQFAAAWHAIMGVFLVCVILAHIYIGTIGMEGAFDAMGSGHVDENWAKEHHSIWAEEATSGEPAVRPAGGGGPRVQPAE